MRLDTPLLAAVLAAHDFEPMLSNPWRSDGSSPWPSPSPTAVWNDASLDPTNDRGDAADMGLSAALPVWAAATQFEQWKGVIFGDDEQWMGASIETF